MTLSSSYRCNLCCSNDLDEKLTDLYVSGAWKDVTYLCNDGEVCLGRMLWGSTHVSSSARATTSEDMWMTSDIIKYVFPCHKGPAAFWNSPLLGTSDAEGHTEIQQPTHFIVLDIIPHSTKAFDHGQCHVQHSSGSEQAPGQHQHRQAGKAGDTGHMRLCIIILPVAASTELHIPCTLPYGHLS